MINLPFSLQTAGTFQGDLCEGLVPIAPAVIAQQGDGDIVVVILVINGETNLPVDLSPATLLSISIQKPGGDVLTPAASLTTNGKDGRISAALGPTDLDEVGYYTVQGLFEIAGAAKSTVLGRFRVGTIIAAPEEP